MGSPVMKGEDIRISEEDYRNAVRGFLLPLWNVYNFFVTYANADGWRPAERSKAGYQASNTLDKWILSRMAGSIQNIIQKGYEDYETQEIVDLARIFIVRDLSLWYVRRSRERQDRKTLYQTLWTVLTTYCQVLAPLIPFVTEKIYRNLTKRESIHLTDWPKISKQWEDKELEKQMEQAIELASAVHAFRKENKIPVRIPFLKLSYLGPSEVKGEVKQTLLDEVNVGQLDYEGKATTYQVKGDISEKNQDLEAGRVRELIRKIQVERKRLGTALKEKVNVSLPSWPEGYEEEIKKRALVKEIKKGKFKVEKALS